MKKTPNKFDRRIQTNLKHFNWLKIRNLNINYHGKGKKEIIKQLLLLTDYVHFPKILILFRYHGEKNGLFLK